MLMANELEVWVLEKCPAFSFLLVDTWYMLEWIGAIVQKKSFMYLLTVK